MSTKNDITGDLITSKMLSQAGRDNWDNIFKPKNKADKFAVTKNIKKSFINDKLDKVKHKIL